MNYSLSDLALADLESIVQYISEHDSPGRAEHVLKEFERHFELLAASPGMGTRRVRLTGEKIRWWPVFKFLVLYQPVSKGVQILRIVHGARELSRLFGVDEDWSL